MNKSLITSIIVGIGLLACSEPVKPPTVVGPVPDARQLAWHEMEKNAFIHFTINTFTDKEWGYGDESPALFNPTDLDAEQWVKVLKETGFKGVILTCKHHDGFSLWPTKYSNHNISQSPYKDGKGDIVKEVADACKKYGLKFGIYLSPWDRNRADYGEPSYVTYYRNQLQELFTNYGDVFEMWFDGANGGDGYYGGSNNERKIDRKTYYDWPTTLDLVRKMQPQVLFFSDGGPDLRWGGNEQARAGFTNWANISTDTLYAGKFGIENLLNSGSENGTSYVPLEANTSIRPGWFYHSKEDSMVKSPEKLLDIYLTSVGRGSTLLLNIPPDRRGLFHENDVKALYEWDTLLKKEFGTNLTNNSKITASNTRGNALSYSPSNVLDNDSETYWATDDEVKTASIEIQFDQKETIKYVLLQEYIKLGQRIKSFTIEAWNDNQWQEISSATTIGFKRILKLESPVTSDKIRINITGSKACPVISTIEVY